MIRSLEIFQKNDTSLILYDVSQEYENALIPIPNIKYYELRIIELNKIYRWYSHLPIVAKSTIDYHTYLNTNIDITFNVRTWLTNVEPYTETIVINSMYSDINMLLYDINKQFIKSGLLVSLENNKIMLGTDSKNGNLEFELELVDDDGRGVFGIDVGYYNNNHFVDAKLNELQFDITPTMLNGVLKEGLYHFELAVNYDDTIIHNQYDSGLSTYTTSFKEWAYVQTELYKGKMFEKLAKFVPNFNNIGDRINKQDEVFVYSAEYFDALFKVFQQTIYVGNDTLAQHQLEYLQNIQRLNPDYLW